MHLNNILTGGVGLGGVLTKPSARSRRAKGGSDNSHYVKNIGLGCPKARVTNCDLCPLPDCEHPTFKWHKKKKP